MLFRFPAIFALFSTTHLVLGVAVLNEPLPLTERSPDNFAGLYWGPYYVGDLKLYVTNVHVGTVGPKFKVAPHVNVHVDRKAERCQYDEVVNLHVVKYMRAEQHCLYMWDSVSKSTVFDNCFDSFEDTAQNAVNAAKQLVDSVMDGVAFAAKAAATVALAVALAAILLLLDLASAATG